MMSSSDGTTGTPTVVWLHGAGMDRTVWALAAREPRLSGYRSLAIDLPGHGRSDEPGRNTIGEYAERVLQLLDEQALPSVRLVGHSMGALIALTIARHRPERIQAVALAGAAAAMPVNPALLAAAIDDLPRAARMIATFAVAPAQRRAAQDTPGVRVAGAGMALLERSRPGVLAADLRACDAARIDAGRLAIPSLVVTGTLDRMTLARRGRELAEALGAAHVPIEGAGHMMMLERPQAFADAVVPFLLDPQASSRAR